MIKSPDDEYMEQLEAEIEALSTKVAELEEDRNLMRRVAVAYENKLYAEQDKVKVLVDALETFNKQYPHMVKGYILDALATVKEK